MSLNSDKLRVIIGFRLFFVIMGSVVRVWVLEGGVKVCVGLNRATWI